MEFVRVPDEQLTDAVVVYERSGTRVVALIERGGVTVWVQNWRSRTELTFASSPRSWMEWQNDYGFNRSITGDDWHPVFGWIEPPRHRWWKKRHRSLSIFEAVDLGIRYAARQIRNRELAAEEVAATRETLRAVAELDRHLRGEHSA